MRIPIKELIFGLLQLALIIIPIWWISRIGPNIDNKIVRMTSKYFQPTAWWISWVMAAATLAFALAVASRAPNKILAAAVFGMIPAAHLVLMLKKKYLFAYWCASGEILIVLFVFGVYCVGDPERGVQTLNITPGAAGFWVFIFGSLTLATLAWICHRAAKDIRNGTRDLHAPT